MSDGATLISKITGLPPGPYPVGVTTIEFVDKQRTDPGNPSEPRRLQTELWYPAISDDTCIRNKYSDFLGGGAIPNSIDKANDSRAIGGYRDGLTVQELDESVWINDAFRNATPQSPTQEDPKWPLVLFSHGAGAFRVSYIYWTEFLASHGYVVAAPDHPGSARYTQVGGKVITPYDSRKRSEYQSMAKERPKDMITVLNGIQGMTAEASDKTTVVTAEAPTTIQQNLANSVDCHNVGITGMSFGGQTTANVLELQDARIRAGVLKCPSLHRLPSFSNLKNRKTPILVMLGTEDTVIGSSGNDAAREYVKHHTEGPAGLFEIKRGGHVSFTSCEIYDPEYGNGIGTNCPSLTNPGDVYQPLDIVQQHKMINTYGLAFLDKYLKGIPSSILDADTPEIFTKDELIIRFNKHM